MQGDGIPRLVRLDDGVEVIVHGDEARHRLALEVVERRDGISAAAVRLLCAFLRESFGQEREAFDLISIEVSAATEPDGADVTLIAPDKALHLGPTDQKALEDAKIQCIY